MITTVLDKKTYLINEDHISVISIRLDGLSEFTKAVFETDMAMKKLAIRTTALAKMFEPMHKAVDEFKDAARRRIADSD